MRGRHEQEVIVGSCSKLTYVVLRSNVSLFETHCNVSQKCKDNPQLGTWVSISGKSSPKTVPEAHRSMPLKDWIQVDSEIWKKEEELNLSVDLRRNKKLFRRSTPTYSLGILESTSLCCSCKC